MGLTFATPNGGNSAKTGHKNKNNNAKATAKVSKRGGHPGATAPAPKAKKKKAAPKPKAKVTKGSPHERNTEANVTKAVKVKKAAPVVQKPKAKVKVTQGSPHERNTEANVTTPIGKTLSSAVSTGLLGGVNNSPVTEIPVIAPPKEKFYDSFGNDYISKLEANIMDNFSQKQSTDANAQQGINDSLGNLGLQLGDATLGLGGQLGDVQLGLGNQIGGLGDQLNTGFGDLNTGLGQGQENIGLQVEGLGNQLSTFGQDNVDKLNGIEDLISELQGTSSESDTQLADSITGVVGKFKDDVKGLVGGIGDSITGIGDSITNMNDPIKRLLEFNKRGGVFGEIFRKFTEQSDFGMNDDAEAEYERLSGSADNQHPNSKWNLMTEKERVALARKPQMDNQLAHAFIDGHPTTPDQIAIAKLTGGKSPGSSVYNADGSVNIQATAAMANNGGGNGGVAQAPAAGPKWWEPGYQPPGDGGGGIWTPQPNPPQYGGGQQVPGLPAYLQQEMAYTPDFTGSFQPSLLGNTTLPSQQITGLLAPPAQQKQQQFDPKMMGGLLRGFM